MPRKDRPEINDRSQWNSGSGRENPKPRFHGPQEIANKDNPGNSKGPGVKFDRITGNKARNLGSGGARGY